MCMVSKVMWKPMTKSQMPLPERSEHLKEALGNHSTWPQRKTSSDQHVVEVATTVGIMTCQRGTVARMIL